MQSSPPTRDGKARTLRELSRSLSHSPRQIPSPSPPPSDSNPTKRSGFDTATSNFFNDPDVLMSTQHKIEEDTNALPQYPRIRSTAKKVNAWHMLRSEPPIPDTSMVDKEFRDFDGHSLSDEEDFSVEQARGVNRSNHGTPMRGSSQFNSLYDITPPSNRTRKSHAAETGSLRRDAQIRRASRNDLDSASPRLPSKRNSPAIAENQDRRHASLAQLHAKLSEDESSFMDQRPPTLTIDSTKNTRWGNRSRQVSGQLDQTTEHVSTIQAKALSRPGTAHNATAQSFILPDLPNLTELVSGVFEDGTPVFSKTAPARSRFSAPPGGSRRPQHIPITGVPIPEEEKLIFAALQQLQDKVAQMEQERAAAEKTIEEQDLELIELRATNRAQEKLRRSESGLDPDSGIGSWKVEKTRLDATVQTLRTKLDRAERKVAVLEIEKKRLTTERDNMANQLSVAFQTCEELKREKASNRDEWNILRTENETLREKLDRERSQHQEETVQLRRQFDQAASATEKENMTLHAELSRIRTENEDHTVQLARKETELRAARQEQAEFDRLKHDHEHLKSQLANLKARRDEDVKRWARQEAELKAQAHHHDETIQHVHRISQQATNEAMRQDIESLREELLIWTQMHEDEHQQWMKKEAEMKHKIRQRGVPSSHEKFESHDQPNNTADEASRRKSNYQRDNTRTRIQSRVEQEVRNSRPVNPAPTSRQDESLRSRSVPMSKLPTHEPQPARSYRNFSAPVTTGKPVEIESEIDSTTDLSLAPREHRFASQSTLPVQAPVSIQTPADLDLTELSYIDGAQIAKLRRILEQEHIAARSRALSNTVLNQRDETSRSQHVAKEDTLRSVISVRSDGLSMPRKSSLKDITQRTNVTRFEEDATGNTSNFDATTEPTQDKEPAGDDSRLSNTGRRRRSAPTEMTSAFIVPDIKLDNRKDATTSAQVRLTKDHDNSNCTVCRRESIAAATVDLRVPKLVPVSSRMPDDVDATLRPARSPRDALALVVKELKDERAHLHMELAVMRTMLESHDSSLGNRKRGEINASIHDILRRLEVKDTQIYNLYDVLEGQQSADLTDVDVENITAHIRTEEEKVHKEPEKRGKKVTIRSFVEDNSVQVGRSGCANVEDETEELPWEGFEDSGLDDADLGISGGWSMNAH